MNQITINETEATKLLDFNQKFDISLLDRVITSLYQVGGLLENFFASLFRMMGEVFWK